MTFIRLLVEKSLIAFFAHWIFLSVGLLDCVMLGLILVDEFGFPLWLRTLFVGTLWFLLGHWRRWDSAFHRICIDLLLSFSKQFFGRLNKFS